MTATFGLGRIGGVRIGVHWSVLVIVVLLVAGVAFGQLPVTAPGYSVAAYLIAGVVTAALFVFSIFAHEIGHALVAKREGVEVDSITLWLLGGVARLRGTARTPGAELRIAGVGPLVSVLAGLIFGALAWIAGVSGFPLLAVAVLGYLAVINTVLAVFNLVPAAPLDGGRILRAIIWAWKGDRHRATVWSARAGRVFGFALIGFGLVRMMLGSLGAGVWWVIIGLFIVSVATAEERISELGTTLAGVRVRDVMTPRPYVVDALMTVSAFLRDVAPVRRHAAFPLVDPDGQLHGMITLNRLRAVAPDDRDTTVLRDVACPPEEIPRADQDEPLTALLARMDGCADGRALVFERGRVIGIVSPSDISRAVSLRGLDVDWHDGADVTVDHRREPQPVI